MTREVFPEENTHLRSLMADSRASPLNIKSTFKLFKNENQIMFAQKTGGMFTLF